MEEWEQMIEGYEAEHDVKTFIKMLKTAEVVLKQDLALFESEWIISTLFFKPVNLLGTISLKLNDTSWSKPIGDAFKLIAVIVEKYLPDQLYEHIVTLCLLPYSPLIRKEALVCLTQVVRVSAEGARDAPRLVSELEDMLNCKTQLAVLVGAICEHHPEVVADSATRIWRIYLNLLDSNKNTDTVTQSVLQGLLSLFKHFGTELPIIEFRDLYEKITKEYIQKGKCEEVCLSILERHSLLFKELISQDVKLRSLLWSLRASPALRAVYETVATAVNKEQLQKIVQTELLPRTKSTHSQLKFTSLRILRSLTTNHGVEAVRSDEDVLALEQEVKMGKVSNDAADAMLWCIESNALYSEKLLQAAVLFHNNIPVAKRQDIVVHGLLNAKEEVRIATVTLLINECCQQKDGNSIDTYLPLWRDIFDAKNGTDSVVLENSRLVFDDFMEHLFMVLEAALEEEGEEPPQKLSPLFTLTHHIVTLHPCEGSHESRLSRALRELAARFALSAGLLCVCWTFGEEASVREICKMVRLDKCRDEALLCESCNLLIHAPEQDVDCRNVLMAIEILLTRRDVSPQVLSQTLKRLENIIDHSDVDENKLNRLLVLVEKLRMRKDMTGKEARILHRDVILFMGKYGNNNYTANELSDTTMIAELKDKLVLNVPNPDEGSTYKLNLQTILQLAVTHEDADALQKLLSIICATLSTSKDASLQLSLTCVARALCRAHAHARGVDAASVQHAVLLCDSVGCLTAFIAYISEEKSPGVRKMLSDALEGLLLKDPGSEATEQLVKVAAEHAAVMMASSDVTVRSGGLNITDTLLSALKDNHLLLTKELPNLLTLILETEDLDSKTTFKTAYKLLIDNFELFTNNDIDNIVETLTKNLLKNITDLSGAIERKIFKDRVKSTLEFFREIRDFDFRKLLSHCKLKLNFDVEIYLIAESGLPTNEVLEKVLVKITDFDIKCEGKDIFTVEAILKFLEVYAKPLLDDKKEETMQALGKIISSLTPDYIINFIKQIKSCVTIYTEILEEPNTFTDDFQNWYQKFKIKDVIESIDKYNIQIDEAKELKSLNLYLQVLNIPSLACDDELLNLNDLAFEIYVKNGEKYIETYKECLSDMLQISLRYKDHEELKGYIRKSFDMVELKFLKYFILVFSEFLLRKPYVLLEQDMKPICVILNDIVKSTLKKKCLEEDGIRILELVDALWPTYEEQATFESKHALLLLTTRLPLQLSCDSAAMRWAVMVVGEGGREERVKLVGVLPGGEECSSAYRSFASQLPVRVSEMSGADRSALQALIDACADTADNALLDIIMKLADCNHSKGWWDEAMASAMALLARRGDCRLPRLKIGEGDAVVEAREVSLMSIANTLFEFPSTAVSKKLLVPLLRYSSSSFCEKFYASIINKLLASLSKWVRESERDNRELRKCLSAHAKALTLITLAFEKIPLQSLKSPDSLIYSEVTNKQPSYLMKRASVLCLKLRDQACRKDASVELKEYYREFQASIYKCLCAAICITRPAAKLYDYLFSGPVWEKLFDCDAVRELPLRTQWTQQKSVHTVADVSTGSSTRSSGTTSSTRTRIFLRSLSENPLQFDLMDVDEEPPENSQELELVVNEINSQDCADTLTALFKHVASLAHTGWLDRLTEALIGSHHRNVKWTLAQMIVNCKEELKPHASTLRPPLLALTADTPRELSGRKLLNNLHVDVLETILSWKDLPDLPESSINNLTSTIEYLMNTCIDNDQYASLHNSLVNLLHRLVEAYGERLVVPWRCFEDFVLVPDKLKTLQRILITITKNKINIPELLPTLVKLEEKLWPGNTKLPELFGLALACGSEIDRPLAQYRHFLDRKRQNDVREYVQLLYYAQMGYPKVCDEFNFKKIIDLTPKVSGPIKSKCLRIISTYMSHSRSTDSTSILESLDLCSLLHEVPLEAMKVVEGLTLGGRLGRAVSAVILPYVGHSDVKLRSQAVMVLLKAFEDLFSPKQNEPSAKRSKLNSSKLLSTLESPDTYTSQVIQCVALGVTDTDTSIASMARDRVAECLNSEDMKIRLAEAFLISIGIPATVTSKNRSLPVCVSAFLDILFKRLRAQERFKEAKLRDEPLEIRDPSSIATKLLTNTRTYQGTFLSSMGRKPRNKQATSFTGIDVQIPIDSILESLINLAKDQPDVAQALCVEVSKSILSVDRGFDPGASLSRQICDVLSAAAGDVTPLTVEVARLMVEDVGKQLDFESCLDKLRQDTRCTEGENLVQLLHEEVRMRRESDIFELGTVFDDCGTGMEVDNGTSLEDIMSAFGKLSNWDRLTEQQKKEVNSSGIPQLWVDEDTFRTWIDDHQVVNKKSWFDKLLSACRDESKQDSLRWLRETDRWPRKHFDISVVTEAIERQDWSEGEMKSTCEMRPSDCLVEWAARLMLRKAFPGANDSESSEVTSPCLANELEWCRAANERGLPRLAMNCVEVNGSSLQTTDGTSWQIEKAFAMRSIGLETNDVEMLGDALAVLDFKVTQLNECSKNEIILMNRLTVALHQDLGSLSKNNLKNIIETTNKYTDRQHYSMKNKEMLCQLYEMAISYYDDIWTKDPSEQNDVLNSMADVLGHVVDLNQAKAEMFLAVIFNRLDDFKAIMDDVTARNLLVKMSILIQNLDDTSLAQIKCHSSLFPQSILEEFSSITAALSLGDSEYTYRQQLRLVCDARHSLLRRCSMLNNYVGDPLSWKKTFDLLKESIFENPFAGNSTEYNVLKKYKMDLYEIEDYESTDSKQKSSVLKKTLQELLQKTPARASLRLSQLCPALAKYNHNTSERDDSLSRLLKLGKLGVVKFYEQVSVFCYAETRPVVLTALLTDGSTRRFIHKTGDRLRVDASAQRVAAAVSRICGGRVVGYSVTPLGEDGGLIEFVENTTRLRALIKSEFELDDVDIGARAEDEVLILASSSLEHHKNFCQQVPAYALRSAIEANCSSTEDFISKKQMFMETLSSITILSWLLGLGDRHLENILYSIKEGALCCVDWTAIFQCGIRELPPARLTRNLLAVCHLQALEARLQNLVKSLRASHKLFLNVLKVSFKWMGEEFFSKFPYIEQYATGLATSRDVTKQALLASNRRYKERIVKLLDETFTDSEVKDQYSVVEQVSCLLRQCTDPRILSVTRSGWEPWV